MNCIKCGKEHKSAHIFCEECCAGMKAYPVKPGTPINLPARRVYTVDKKKTARKRRFIKSEERIAKLRSSNRWLVAALLITWLAFLAACGALIAILKGWIPLPF